MRKGYQRHLALILAWLMLIMPMQSVMASSDMLAHADCAMLSMHDMHEMDNNAAMTDKTCPCSMDQDCNGICLDCTHCQVMLVPGVAHLNSSALFAAFLVYSFNPHEFLPALELRPPTTRS